MTTFDMAEVREFTNDVWSRMDQCDNGEGMQCANLDDTLRRYATLCREFHERVRQWGRAVLRAEWRLIPQLRTSGKLRDGACTCEQGNFYQRGIRPKRKGHATAWTGSMR